MRATVSVIVNVCQALSQTICHLMRGKRAAVYALLCLNRATVFTALGFSWKCADWDGSYLSPHASHSFSVQKRYLGNWPIAIPTQRELNSHWWESNSISNIRGLVARCKGGVAAKRWKTFYLSYRFPLAEVLVAKEVTIRDPSGICPTSLWLWSTGDRLLPLITPTHMFLVNVQPPAW